MLVGHEGHEEVEGTTGEAPEHIVLVQTEEDVERLEVDDPDKVAFITQTTLSVDETMGIIRKLREQFPNMVGPAHRRHLLRDAEPPGRGQAARSALRPGARDRLTQLLQLQPARRGRAPARRAART